MTDAGMTTAMKPGLYIVKDGHDSSYDILCYYKKGSGVYYTLGGSMETPITDGNIDWLNSLEIIHKIKEGSKGMRFTGTVFSIKTRYITSTDPLNPPKEIELEFNARNLPLFMTILKRYPGILKDIGGIMEEGAITLNK